MLITLEGIDGSGKATQTRLLVDALKKQHGTESVITLSFPRYGQSFFADEAGAYLDGERGTLENVHPHFSAMLFAGDRFEAKPEIEAALAAGKIIVCDRYVASNTAHQGARLPADQREAFYTWNDRLEHQVYGLPRPDISLFINTPPDIAWHMVEKKAARDYTEKKRDIQEAKADYMKEVYGIYQQLAQRQNWVVINCVGEGKIRGVEAIFEDVMARVSMISS